MNNEDEYPWLFTQRQRLTCDVKRLIALIAYILSTDWHMLTA